MAAFSRAKRVLELCGYTYIKWKSNSFVKCVSGIAYCMSNFHNKWKTASFTSLKRFLYAFKSLSFRMFRLIILKIHGFKTAMV